MNQTPKRFLRYQLLQYHNHRVIFFAGTFIIFRCRNKAEESPVFSCSLQLIDADILIVIKKHYLQVPYDFGENVLTNIVYLENRDLADNGLQLYEFINCSDALVSDYSSVAIDYLLLDRPLGFTLDDYEAYTESRGWVFDDPLEYMPGEHMYNMQDFENFILDIKNGKDNYKEQRASVRAKTHNVCDNYCQRVLDYFNITM